MFEGKANDASTLSSLFSLPKKKEINLQALSALRILNNESNSGPNKYFSFIFITTT